MNLPRTLYCKLFSSKGFSSLNEKLLSLALAARGYNNYENGAASGENFFIESVLSKTNPSLCFDVGANVGNVSLALLKSTNSRVVAFEPMPEAYEGLLERTSCYENRICCENSGVGSVNKKLEIYYNPSNLEHASFETDITGVEYISNKQNLEVEVVTLDRYCHNNGIEHIDFIKIDTEGHEMKVFEGAKNVFGRIRPRFIQIEFNWHQLFCNNTLRDFSLKLQGYDVFQLLPNGWVQRDPNDPLTNIYYFSNFVFVRRG